MEQVLQCYGKGIAAGIVLITVMVLLFAGIRDEQGNRGIINIIKTWIPEEETITENAAIDAFAEAGEVAYPTIRFEHTSLNAHTYRRPSPVQCSVMSTNHF